MLLTNDRKCPVIISPKMFRRISKVLCSSHIPGLTLARLSYEYLAEMKKTFSFGKNFKSMESVNNLFFGRLILPASWRSRGLPFLGEIHWLRCRTSKPQKGHLLSPPVPPYLIHLNIAPAPSCCLISSGVF